MLGEDDGDRQVLPVGHFVWQEYFVHHDWQPGQPIELLPALRGRYPGCIDDSVLSVQLWGTRSLFGNGQGTDWEFHVVRPQNDVLHCSVLPISEERSDSYDYSDHPWHSIPEDLIQEVLKSNRIKAWQKTFGLFKPEMFELMCRLRYDAEDAAAEDADLTKRQSDERADFLLDLVNLLSGELAGQVDLEKQVTGTLKIDYAFGLRAEETKSRWIEIGAEAYQPSILYEEAKRQVASLAAERFGALPRATQVAIWFSNQSESFPGGDEIDKWDPPRGTVHDMKLFDMHEVFYEVANNVMSAASEDYGNSVT